MVPSCSRILLQQSLTEYSSLNGLIFPSFSKSQLMPLAHNLMIPLPHCFCMLILWQQGRTYLTPPGYQTRTSAMGSHCYNHHATNQHCISILTIYLTLPSQSRTDPGHVHLSSCCTRHFFSLPYHAPEFSQIYPLGGPGRHV